MLLRIATIMLVLAGWCMAGCRITRNIVDLQPPPGLPSLQKLEKHLNYADPDAGQPDYVRTK